MIICEFCIQYCENGQCRFGLNIPGRMGCREFDPGIEKFCSKPEDFVNAGQIIQMAAFFGIKGTEMKKVKLMAAQEDKAKARLKKIDFFDEKEPVEYGANVIDRQPSGGQN